MPTPAQAETTTFSLDVAGRYVCNGLDEAFASTSGRADARRFDVVVIGGGTFGSAVAEHLWFRDQQRSHRILVLEGGPMTLQEHVQNTTILGLDVPGPATIPDLRKARRDAGQSDADPLPPRNEVWGLPWQSTTGFPGLAYTLGGRSIYWGGWSPRLLPDELTSWPPSVVADLDATYFGESAKQLGVTKTNDFLFGELHTALRQQLSDGLGTVANAIPLAQLPDFQGLTGGETPDELGRLLGFADAGGRSADELRRLLKLEAPLAVEASAPRAGFFPLGKFSAVPLLIKAARAAYAESNGDDVSKRLMVVPRCHAIRLRIQPTAGGTFRVTGVETNQGLVELAPQGVAIIALGTIESARLVLASFEGRGLPTYGLVGRNLMAHLRSNLTIRIPREAIPNLPAIQELQTSALFVKGKHTDAAGTGFFHLQITASGLGAGGRGSEAELFKKIPDIDFFEEHRRSTDTHVVITIRGIGEMTPLDVDVMGAHPSRVELDPSNVDEYGVKRAFVTLTVTDRDRALWDAMDAATDAVAKLFANGRPFEVLLDNGDRLCDATTDLSTISPYVPKGQNPAGRRDGMGTTHHECGTLMMHDDPARGVTDADGRLHHTDNLYALGPALFPTVGSPNPMLTGIALGRRMGDTIVRPRAVTADAGFTLLFDGTAMTHWKMSTIRNQPGRDNPGSFVISSGALEARPGTDLGLLWYDVPTPADFVLRLEWMRTAPDDNSGIFVRFPHPDSQNYDNTAYVAIQFGLEVQIDEQARPDGAPIHRTGAMYGLQGPDLARLNVRDVGEWNQTEITVQGNRFLVVINGQPVNDFTFPPGSDPQFPTRALPPTPAEPRFIGLQAHTGRVRFRKVQWRAL